MTTKQLTRRQARWAETLGCFDFHIRFRPGRKSSKPDTLSRRPDLEPSAHEKLSFGSLLRPENVSIWTDDEIMSRIRETSATDPRIQGLIDTLSRPAVPEVKDSLRGYEVHDGVLYRDGLVEVPDDKTCKFEIVNNFVDGCDSCTRVKPSTLSPFGSLEPLPSLTE